MMGLPLLDKLLGSEVAQGLVRADGIVDFFPGLELLIEGRHRPARLHHFVKLLPMRPLGPLHMPIQLRGPRREDKQPDLMVATRRLKVSRKLTPPIHLNRPDGKRHAAHQTLQKVLRGPRRCRAVRLHDIPPRQDIPPREVLHQDPGQRPDIEGVDFHQIPGPPDL